MRLALAAVAFLAASAAAEAARAPVALIASPAHVSIGGSGVATVRVTNAGTQTAVVDVSRGGLALDLRGRPLVLARRRSWLALGQRELTVAPGGTAQLEVRAAVPAGAPAGDHSELVLFQTRPSAGQSIAVRARLGVVVVVRAPGRVVHRVDVVRLHRVARRLEIEVANRGNVTESVGGACSTVTLSRGPRVVARLHPAARQLLPRSRGIVELRPPPVRGPVVVRVDLCVGRPRAFALRL